MDGCKRERTRKNLNFQSLVYITGYKSLTEEEHGTAQYGKERGEKRSCQCHLQEFLLFK